MDYKLEDGGLSTCTFCHKGFSKKHPPVDLFEYTISAGIQSYRLVGVCHRDCISTPIVHGGTYQYG